ADPCVCPKTNGEHIGSPLQAGIYFIKLETVPINRDFPSRSLSGQVGSASTGEFKATRKLTILK
ncbi:MAG: hypothetical protein HY769_09705, partial [Candidatus Stahlbacteria bacterium]|nr:hypothetical protein [Candidatus Stahlbacteria bacterium]MBI4723246.1 hypothetical protein [Candidatus Stahlbacteria bacterium]